MAEDTLTVTLNSGEQYEIPESLYGKFESDFGKDNIKSKARKLKAGDIGSPYVKPQETKTVKPFAEQYKQQAADYSASAKTPKAKESALEVSENTDTGKTKLASSPAPMAVEQYEEDTRVEPAVEPVGGDEIARPEDFYGVNESIQNTVRGVDDAVDEIGKMKLDPKQVKDKYRDMARRQLYGSMYGFNEESQSDKLKKYGLTGEQGEIMVDVLADEYRKQDREYHVQKLINDVQTANLPEGVTQEQMDKYNIFKNNGFNAGDPRLTPEQNAFISEMDARIPEYRKRKEAALNALNNDPTYIAVKNEHINDARKKISELTQMRDAFMDEHAKRSDRPVVSGAQQAAAGIDDFDWDSVDNLRQYQYMGQAIDLLNKELKTWSAPEEGGFLRGAKDMFTDKDFWTDQITKVARDINIRGILEKVASEAEKTGDKKSLEEIAGPGGAALINQFMSSLDAQAKRSANTGNGYNAGVTATEAIPFMIEFMVTSGVGNAAKEATEKILLKAGNKWYTRLLAKSAGGLAEAAARMPFMGSTYGNIADKLVELDDNDNLKFTRERAIVGGSVDQGFEVLSEGFGNVGKSLGINAGAVAKKFGGTKIGNIASVLEEIGAFAGNNDFLSSLGKFNGIFGEMSEEVVGTAYRMLASKLGMEDVFGDAGEQWDQFTDRDNLKTMFYGFLPMSIVGAGVNSINRARTKAGVKEATGMATGQMEAYRNQLVSTLKKNGVYSETIANKIAQTSNMTPEELRALEDELIKSVIHKNQTNRKKQTKYGNKPTSIDNAELENKIRDQYQHFVYYSGVATSIDRMSRIVEDKNNGDFTVFFNDYNTADTSGAISDKQAEDKTPVDSTEYTFKSRLSIPIRSIINNCLSRDGWTYTDNMGNTYSVVRRFGDTYALRGNIGEEGVNGVLTFDLGKSPMSRMRDNESRVAEQAQEQPAATAEEQPAQQPQSEELPPELPPLTGNEDARTIDAGYQEQQSQPAPADNETAEQLREKVDMVKAIRNKFGKVFSNEYLGLLRNIADNGQERTILTRIRPEFVGGDENAYVIGVDGDKLVYVTFSEGKATKHKASFKREQLEFLEGNDASDRIKAIYDSVISSENQEEAPQNEENAPQQTAPQPQSAEEQVETPAAQQEEVPAEQKSIAEMTDEEFDAAIPVIQSGKNKGEIDFDAIENDPMMEFRFISSRYGADSAVDTMKKRVIAAIKERARLEGGFGARVLSQKSAIDTKIGEYIDALNTLGGLNLTVEDIVGESEATEQEKTAAAEANRTPKRRPGRPKTYSTPDISIQDAPQEQTEQVEQVEVPENTDETAVQQEEKSAEPEVAPAEPDAAEGAEQTRPQKQGQPTTGDKLFAEKFGTYENFLLRGNKQTADAAIAGLLELTNGATEYELSKIKEFLNEKIKEFGKRTAVTRLYDAIFPKGGRKSSAATEPAMETTPEERRKAFDEAVALWDSDVDTAKAAVKAALASMTKQERSKLYNEVDKNFNNAKDAYLDDEASMWNSIKSMINGKKGKKNDVKERPEPIQSVTIGNSTIILTEEEQALTAQAKTKAEQDKIVNGILAAREEARLEAERARLETSPAVEDVPENIDDNSDNNTILVENTQDNENNGRENNGSRAGETGEAGEREADIQGGEKSGGVVQEVAEGEEAPGVSGGGSAAAGNNSGNSPDNAQVAESRTGRDGGKGHRVQRLEQQNKKIDALLGENSIPGSNMYVDQVSASKFESSMKKAVKSNPNSWMVDVKSVDEYKECICLLSEDGKSGVAVTPDGDIVSLFSSVSGEQRANKLLLMAIENGGRKLDFYTVLNGKGLQDIYSQFGAKITSYVDFNPEYVPNEHKGDGSFRGVAAAFMPRTAEEAAKEYVVYHQNIINRRKSNPNYDGLIASAYKAVSKKFEDVYRTDSDGNYIDTEGNPVSRKNGIIDKWAYEQMIAYRDALLAEQDAIENERAEGESADINEEQPAAEETVANTEDAAEIYSKYIDEKSVFGTGKKMATTLRGIVADMKRDGISKDMIDSVIDMFVESMIKNGYRTSIGDTLSQARKNTQDRFLSRRDQDTDTSLDDETTVIRNFWRTEKNQDGIDTLDAMAKAVARRIEDKTLDKKYSPLDTDFIDRDGNRSNQKSSSSTQKRSSDTDYSSMTKAALASEVDALIEEARAMVADMNTNSGDEAIRNRAAKYLELIQKRDEIAKQTEKKAEKSVAGLTGSVDISRVGEKIGELNKVLSDYIRMSGMSSSEIKRSVVSAKGKSIADNIAKMDEDILEVDKKLSELDEEKRKAGSESDARKMKDELENEEAEIHDEYDKEVDAVRELKNGIAEAKKAISSKTKNADSENYVSDAEKEEYRADLARYEQELPEREKSAAELKAKLDGLNERLDKVGRDIKEQSAESKKKIAEINKKRKEIDGKRKEMSSKLSEEKRKFKDETGYSYDMIFGSTKSNKADSKGGRRKGSVATRKQVITPDSGVITSDNGTKPTRKQIRTLVNRLKRALPGFVNVNVLSGEEFAKALERENGGSVDLFNEDDNTCGFVAKDGTVYINADNCRIDTPLHEIGIHKVMDIAKSLAENGDARLRDAILEYGKNAPEEFRQEVLDNYDLEEDTDEFYEEVAAHTFGAVYADRQSEYANTPAWKRFLQRIKEFFQNLFGGRYANIDVFDAIDTLGEDELGDRLYDLCMGGKAIAAANSYMRQNGDAVRRQIVDGEEVPQDVIDGVWEQMTGQNAKESSEFANRDHASFYNALSLAPYDKATAGEWIKFFEQYGARKGGLIHLLEAIDERGDEKGNKELEINQLYGYLEDIYENECPKSVKNSVAAVGAITAQDEPKEIKRWFARNMRSMRKLGHEIRRYLSSSYSAFTKIRSMVMEADGIVNDDFELVCSTKESRIKSAFNDVFLGEHYNRLEAAVAALEATGVDHDELRDYLTALHAKERNRMVVSREIADRLNEKNKDNRDWEELTASDIAPLYGIVIDDEFDNPESYEDIADDVVEEIKRILSDDYLGNEEALAKVGVDSKGNFITNAMADEIIDRYDAAHSDVKDKTDEVIARLKDTSDWILDYSANRGLLSKGSAERLKEMYQHYIPLVHWEKEDDRDRAMQTAEDMFETRSRAKEYAYGISSNIQRSARGRKTRAADPFAMLVYNAYSEIRSGEENRSRMAIFDLIARNQGLTELFYVGDKNNAPEWVNEGIISARNSRRAGENKYKIQVFVNGRLMDMYINGFFGSSLAGSLGRYFTIDRMFVDLYNRAKEKDSEIGTKFAAAGVVMGNVARWGTALMAKVATVKNIAFVFGTNPMRDLLRAPGQARIDGGHKLMIDYFKSLAEYNGNILGGSIAQAIAFTIGGYEGVSQEYRDFLNNGGNIGFCQSISVDDARANTERSIRRLVRRNGKRERRGIGYYIGRAAEAIENISRFSAYLAVIREGGSKERAAYEAHQVATDLSKRGRQTILSKNIMFANAALQDLDQTLTNFRNHPLASLEVYAVYGGVLTAAIVFGLRALADASGGDDDKDKGKGERKDEDKYKKNRYARISDYIKKDGFIVPFGGFDTYGRPTGLRMRYAFGYRLASYMTQISIESYYDDNVSFMECVEKVAKAIIDEYVPNGNAITGNEGVTLSSFAPEIFKPAIQVITNKNSFGNPIYYDVYEKTGKYGRNGYERGVDETVPKYINMRPGKPGEEPEGYGVRPGTSVPAIAVSKALWEISGGKEDGGVGRINIHPETIDYLVENTVGLIASSVSYGVLGKGFLVDYLSHKLGLISDMEYEYYGMRHPITGTLWYRGDEKLVVDEFVDSIIHERDYNISDEEREILDKAAAMMGEINFENFKEKVKKADKDYKNYMRQAGYNANIPALNKVSVEHAEKAVDDLLRLKDRFSDSYKKSSILYREYAKKGKKKKK